MPYQFGERPGKRQSDTKALTESREYFITGVDDPIQIRTIARTEMPDQIATEQGILYRQGFTVSEQGVNLYYITASYGKDKLEPSQVGGPGNFSISYDTTGGTVNIKTGYEETASKAEGDADTPPDTKSTIGSDAEGEPAGVDIVIPALKLTVNFKHPAGVIGTARAANIARQTGKMNSTPFLGFDPGEVLFLGMSGSEGTDTETNISYQFACSENIVGEIIGGIEVPFKAGWDVMTVKYHDVVSNGQKAKQAKYIYITRVYRQFDMAGFFGFGG